jgi:hypothetical protein
MFKIFRPATILSLGFYVLIGSSFLFPNLAVYAIEDTRADTIPAQTSQQSVGSGSASTNASLGSGDASVNATPINTTSNSGSSEPLMFHIVNPLGPGSTDLFSFVVKIVNLATKIAIPIIILMIIYAGFLFVKAQGAPEKINEAKTALGYILLGAGIILGANVIALAVGATVNSLIN